MNKYAKKTWSLLEIKKLRHYYKTKTVSEIANKLNRSTNSVKYKIYSLGLVKPSKDNKTSKRVKSKKKKAKARIARKVVAAKIPPRPPKKKPEEHLNKKEKSKQKKNTYISKKKRA